MNTLEIETAIDEFLKPRHYLKGIAEMKTSVKDDEVGLSFELDIKEAKPALIINPIEIVLKPINSKQLF